jgi:hypothetical protein
MEASMLRAILYAMLHPLTGAAHIAYFYGISMAGVGFVMRIGQGIDFVLVLLVLTVLERKLRKKAAK